jgi:hypothetical protein
MTAFAGVASIFPTRAAIGGVIWSLKECGSSNWRTERVALSKYLHSVKSVSLSSVPNARQNWKGMASPSSV